MDIEPQIGIGEPGQPITLYKGQLEVHVGQESDFCEDSCIAFVFLPKPRIEFYLTGTNTFFTQTLFNLNTDCKIKLPNHDIFVDIIIVSKTISFGKQVPQPKIVALQKSEIKWSSSSQLLYIKFYLANFLETLDPIELKSDEWKINIQAQNKSKDIKDYLRYSHNYAVTHIGKIESVKSNTFSLKSTDDIIDSLYYFLSFCRGFWMSPILMYGYDAKHNQTWESCSSRVGNAHGSMSNMSIQMN